MRKEILFVCAFFLLIANIFVTEAAVGSASFVTYAPRASFQAVYGPEDRLNTYWPILGNKEDCKARQDIILEVVPGGCQPAVVRSDLLAEQNVPVFCQIDALQINPLIDIERIKAISFTREYPKEIAAIGFYPARAALRTRDKLLGSPLINNIGYAVIVLKRNEVEKDLPDFVRVNLTGIIDYESEYAYGIGRAEFMLEPISDYDWENTEAKYKNSFWNGRYFVRMEKAEPNYAITSLYEGKRKIATTRVENGKTSEPIWVSGAYCQAGIKVAYDGLVAGMDKAIIEISDNEGTDRISVYKGSRFLDDKCVVQELKINDDGESGSLTIRCLEGKSLILKIEIKKLYLKDGSGSGEKTVYFDKDYTKPTQITIVESEGNTKIKFDNTEIGEVKDGTIKIDESKLNTALNDISNGQKEQIRNLCLLLNNSKITDSEITIEKYSKQQSQQFHDAIAALERVVDEYPQEKEINVDGGKIFGEIALKRAIDLSKKAKAEDEKIRLMKKFITVYPDSSFTESIRKELNGVENLEFSDAITSVEIANTYKTIQLIGFEKVTKKSSAVFMILDTEKEVELGKEYEINSEFKGNSLIKSITLERIIDEESVLATFTCANDGSGRVQLNVSLRIGQESTKVCSGVNVKLGKVNLERVAKIRLIPEARRTETRTNLSITIGIEKRVIKLSTEKTAEMIKNINKSIEKWESINNKLGKVVEGMKGACLATAAILTVKNFFAGLSGEVLARKKVMEGENGWNRFCADAVSAHKYTSITQCFNDNAAKIDADVANAQKAISQVNKKISEIEAEFPAGTTGLLGLSSGIDTEKAAVKYCEYLNKTYNGRGKLNTLLKNCEEGYKKGHYSYTDLRELEYNLILESERDISKQLKESVDTSIDSILTRIEENKKTAEEIEKQKASADSGLPSPAFLSTTQARIIAADVREFDTIDKNIRDKIEGHGGFTHITRVVISGADEFEGGVYLLGLESQGDQYIVKEIIKQKNGYERLDNRLKEGFLNKYKINGIIPQESLSYHNSYQNPQVRYYDGEPSKGVPALIPFDKRDGWYVAIKETLPALGGIRAVDKSGRVVSFYLGNVGRNGRAEFFEGGGDDIFRQFNRDTGQLFSPFPALSEAQTKQKVSQALEAIDEAARQYGNKQVRIRGETYFTGLPAAIIPTMQCQNFMSPRECQILFNVCDPVICPPSRCDFGGKFPVANVIESGIVGSVLLCLPNFNEGVYVPVCLTGIHAGIEGFVSILKNHRDCLQESLETGRTVGICDQIYSVYLCEFFWRQIAPLAQVILPKIIESAYGQGTRGGGEYLSVAAAWQNMDNTIKYFTQTYAINSFKAFQARSVEEVGTEFCKAHISVRAPTSFKTLVEPESPPQFHAWFSETKYSDVTVPATSQYKVFYHIYAGNDQGIYYQVYLRNPPESSYFTMPATIIVSSGFVGRGQYASETRDFTAPEGYRELCVKINEREECGFERVSTSFAINYLTDSYVSGIAKETQITSEKECVSGSVNLGALAVNPSIQTGTEEALVGSNVKRGIVRICSTHNPGSQTDPLRFVEVGYCDDPKLKCWLDKESVKKAITDNNVGMKEATLEELEQIQKEKLAEQGIILSVDRINSEISEIKNQITQIKKEGSIDVNKVKNMQTSLEALFEKAMLNYHKANILYLIGDLKAFVVEKELASTSSATSSVGTSETPQSTSITSSTSEASTSEVSYCYRLGEKEEITIDTFTVVGWFIYLDNERLDIFIRDYFDDSPGYIKDYENFRGSLWVIDKKQMFTIGYINNNIIQVDQSVINFFVENSGKENPFIALKDLNEKEYSSLLRGDISASEDAVNAIIGRNFN